MNKRDQFRFLGDCSPPPPHPPLLTGQVQFSGVNGRNHKYTVHHTYPGVQLFLIDKQPEYTYRVN